MPQTFAYPHPVNADTSAHSYGESGRIGVAKKEAPERANVRGFGHSITVKAIGAANMSVPNSPANTAELIAEARAWLVEHGYGSRTADMLRRLADALEAATAAPSIAAQVVPQPDRAVIVKAIASVSEHDPDTHDFISPEKAADAVLAALSTQPAAGEDEWGAALHELPTVVVPSIDEQHARESADEWNNHPNVTSGKLPRMMVLTRIAPQWTEVQS